MGIFFNGCPAIVRSRTDEIVFSKIRRIAENICSPFLLPEVVLYLKQIYVQLLNDQTEVVCDNQINSNTFHNSQIVTPFTVAHEVAPITTLEISIDGNSPGVFK